MTIHALLDELVLAYKRRGHDVGHLLRPGLSKAEITSATTGLPFDLPRGAFELFSWRNGQLESAEWDDYEFSLVFRDNTFISLERGLEGYEEINKHYQTTDPLHDWGVDLRQCLPFATFNMAWYVLVCGPHKLEVAEPNPVVTVYQDVGMHFHSLESMLRTCIDWVSHPLWDGLSHLPEEDEKEIWRKHNPGIFDWIS